MRARVSDFRLMTLTPGGRVLRLTSGDNKKAPLTELSVEGLLLNTAENFGAPTIGERP